METRLRMELLEERALLAIDFIAGPLTSPTNRADVGLGGISGFAPVEPTVVVSPFDPGNLVVSSHNRVRLSNNAGGTFTGTFAFTNPAGTTDTGGDTDLIYDSQGRLYWSNLAGIGAGGVSVNEINPVTGANISTVNVRSNGDDKEFITADQTPGSPFQDNLYMVWTGNFGISTTQVYFSRSTNHGVNWSAPLQLSNNAAEGFPWPSDVGVAPNGDVYVSYHAGGSSGAVGTTWVLRSTDGGVTFPQKNRAFLPGQSDITFNVQTAAGAIPQTQFWMQGAAQPWVMPDPARPGNIYVINSDDPNNVHGSAVDDVNIVIARSTNNGLNWATATVPVDVGPGSHQLFPTAAIDEFGNIVVAWYDNRNLAVNAGGRWLLDVFATYSTDGGVTWAAPFQVNDVANPFNPDIGAVNRFAGPPPTTRIGEYFGIDLFGGTAYVAWNGSNPVGGPQVAHQVVYSAFAVNGALKVDGEIGSDTVEIRNIAGNTDFVEVIVNGLRKYAGLREALSGGIAVDTLGANDNLIVDFTNGNPIPSGGLTYNGGAGAANQVTVIGNSDYTLTNSTLTRSAGGAIGLTSVQVASLTGGAAANSFDVGGWTGTGSLNGLGANDTLAATKNANFTLDNALVTASDGLSMTLASIELAGLTGGPGPNAFHLQSWNGPSVDLAGLGGSDTYTLGSGDLDAIAAAVAISDTSGPADAALLNDAGHAKLVDYTIGGTGVSTEFTSGLPRSFLGLTYNGGALELLTLNGSTGANNFYATPDEVTELNINGHNPTFAGPGVDYLEVNFAGTKGRTLTYSGPPLGNGMWEFLGAGLPLVGARKNINFTSIEKFNYFEVLAAAADEGRNSQPIVKIFDAETGDFSIEFQAYETNYRGGVRVAVGDVNGDGIPEVITAPAGSHAPTVKVFNILTGTANDEFQGSIPSPSPGLQVAVGDVTGDGQADVVTGWDAALPIVHIFANNGDYNSPFDDYRAVAGGGFPATPALTAFAGAFSFSFGIGGLAIGNVLGHPGGVGDIVVASAASFAPVVRVFDYFNNGTSYLYARQILPLGFGFFGGGPVSLAVGNVDSASGNADIVMGLTVQGQGRVMVWHNDSNSFTSFVPFTGAGSNAPVHVAIKHTGPPANPGDPASAQIFAAQGPGGRSHEIRRFQPSGVLVDSILENDPEFANGIWLG